MSHVPITDNIYWIGLNDRQTSLFESIWPLPYGVAYNSYLIKADKNVIVDTVKDISPERYLDQIRAVIGENATVDYLIVNHMEPDHSGCVRLLRDYFPNMKVLGTRQAVRFLNNFFGITENVERVNDNDTLDIGGHTLHFLTAPMVHWPETMMTWEATTGVLFSGDAFGGFGTLSGGIFDDQVDLTYYENEILRYFANIVGKYADNVQNAIKKLKESNLDVRVVASTHGPVWRDSPETILDLYDRWSRQETEPGVLLTYASMYGNTERMMEAVAGGLYEAGLDTVLIHDASTTHVSYLIRDAWRYSGLILGAPTYDRGLFPPMQYFVDYLEHKNLSGRICGVFGSSGWSGGGVKSMLSTAQNQEWEVAPPSPEARCAPSEEDLQQCYQMAGQIAKRVKESAS